MLGPVNQGKLEMVKQEMVQEEHLTENHELKYSGVHLTQMN